jgi:thiol:disulfide interchange protein DsbD
MIGVTVSVFGARRKEPPLKVLGAAIAYVLGIAVMYSALGVAAALTGGLFGSALQNPWVSVALGGLFLVLALSMFGLYEMNPPPWLLQAVGGANTTNVIGIFLSGLAVGVIAAPCVGPFVVALLAILAQRGDPLFGFQAMFTLALGLGLPYLFLAMFSNLLQTLPRSGNWMLWVKKVFGVLMVGIGLYYILIGLKAEWAPWVAPAALVLGGLYLGFVDGHGSEKRGFRTLKYALGVLAIAGGVMAFLTLRAEGLRFQPYTEEALRAAFASGRPVMMDFSADWCVPCHELDRYTFTDPRVKDLARRFVAFKVDLTRYNDPGAKALRERYGVTGVPEVLFFRPGGREVREARVLGFMPPAPFLERMSFVAGG